MDRRIVSAAMELGHGEQEHLPSSRLMALFVVGLTALVAMMLAAATPAFATESGSASEIENGAVSREEESEEDVDDEEFDDDSEGTTAGDVSGATQATGDSGRDNSAGTTAGDVSAATAKTGDSGNDGSAGTTAGDVSGATGTSD